MTQDDLRELLGLMLRSRRSASRSMRDRRHPSRRRCAPSSGRGPRKKPAAIPPREARRARLDRARQAGRHDLDAGGRRHQAAVLSASAPATPARSIRSPPAACRSRSARRPRPSRSSWTAARSIASPCSWGEERDTDDADGRVVAASDARPDRAAIEALLPGYTGTISQVPPQYSAIKIDGERAYDLARDGETVDLAGPAGRDPPARAGERARCRHRRVRGRMRQGHLCALARPRYRPGARMSADISRRYGARRSAHSAKTT